ncbi:MAG: hypothetical protein BZ151_06015 [Desulfobacca sp. 4484_104]|nr:MAG: hypothetical protein BZ151_06015 [Desulfobacca sp. 4484_104]
MRLFLFQDNQITSCRSIQDAARPWGSVVDLTNAPAFSIFGRYKAMAESLEHCQLKPEALRKGTRDDIQNDIADNLDYLKALGYAINYIGTALKSGDELDVSVLNDLGWLIAKLSKETNGLLLELQ